jgi:hypothetical protein
MDMNGINANEISQTIDELRDVFDELAKSVDDLRGVFARLTGDAGAVTETADRAGGSDLFTLDRFGQNIVASIYGTGRALYHGGFDDMGRLFLRKLAGKIGDDASDYISDVLGGGFFGDLIGGIAGELIRGIEGLFNTGKKNRLPDVDFAKLFQPPAMLSLPMALLPSSAAFAGRSPAAFGSGGDAQLRTPSANVNVTVNGVVGAPRDVADEIARIVTRTLGDLNRRGA